MEYDSVKGKFRASLRWLFCLVHQAEGDVLDTPEKMVAVEHPFVIVRQQIEVRQEIIKYLTQGALYCAACYAVVSPQLEQKPTDVSEVIQNLARRGFYVLVEDEEVEVNEDVLGQTNPFSEVSHVALIDALMTAHMAKIVSVERVVQIVKKYGSFNASRELPFDHEDALLLWVNKVCCFAVKQHIESSHSNDSTTSSARHRRRWRAKTVSLQVPFMDDLGKDLRDGRCLGVLTSFFLPDLLNIKALKLSDDLTQADTRGNVQLVKTALEKKFVALPLAFQLSVDDVVESSLALKQNVISLVAQLFDWFEGKLASKSSERPLVETHRQLADKSSGQLLVAADQQQPLSSSVIMDTRHDHVQEQLADIGKPPLPKHHHSGAKQEKRESLVEKDSEQSVNKDIRSHVVGGFPCGVSQSMFGDEQQNVHPAHWRHVPLKRGQWMSKSLNSLRKDFPVSMAGLDISRNSAREYTRPETCASTQKQEHFVDSSAQPDNLNETFSCNHESEVVYDQDETDCAIVEEKTVEEDENTKLVEHIVESYADNASTNVETDAPVVSDITVGDDVCAPLIHTELHQEKIVEDQETADIEEVTDEQTAVSHRLVVDTDKDETFSMKSQCEEPLEGQEADEHAEQTERNVDIASSKPSPELLVLRLKLEEKRRTIEQERLQLEAQWEEHKRRVSEIALLEALRRAKSGTSASTKKPSPLLSNQRSIIQRNKWLENGEGGVGRKKEAVANMSCQSCHKKSNSVSVPVSVTEGNEAMAMRETTGSDELSTASSVVRIAADKHRCEENHASPILSDSKRLQQTDDTGEMIILNQTSGASTSRIIEPEATSPRSQPEQCRDEKSGCDKPVGFFVGGWGDEDNKISTDELKRRKTRLLQARQKQLDDEREKRQAEIEKRRQQARITADEQERLRKQKAVEQARISDEQQAKELTQAEIDGLAKEHRKRLVGSSLRQNHENHSTACDFDSRSKQEVPALAHDRVIVCESSADKLSQAAASQLLDAVGYQSKIPTRSNRQLIQNAVIYVCLAGDVNSQMKDNVLEVLEQSEAAHFLILFRDGSGKKFRALYTYQSDSNQLHRLCGKGPRRVDSKMIAELYKYNSGSKSFQVIHSKTLSLSVDAFTIDSQLWQTKRGKSARHL